MTRLLPALTALTLLVTTGVVHGLWTERWRPSDALERAAARVATVPLEIGDWQGKDIDVDAEAFAQAGARGYWARTYTRPGGDSVLVVLMCGRPGKMAVHTPEVCYGGAGYELFESPTTIVVRDEAGVEQGVFWSARFSKQAGGSELRLDWAWGDGHDWQAPGNPRWTFRGRPFLYKLYASHEISPGQAGDPTAELLSELLPKVRDALMP
jgi:hypothetical protein